MRLTFLGHASFLIETAGGATAVTDFNAYVGTPVVPDIVTMNNAHDTHYTSFVPPGVEHVLRGWNPEGGEAKHDVTHLDLRRVVPAPTGIYLDLLVAFGGLSLVIPPGWKVVFDGTTAAGRFEDLTRPVDDPDATVLRIGGLITLAAVEVTSRPVLRPV